MKYLMNSKNQIKIFKKHKSAAFCDAFSFIIYVLWQFEYLVLAATEYVFLMQCFRNDPPFLKPLKTIKLEACVQ